MAHPPVAWLSDRRVCQNLDRVPDFQAFDMDCISLCPLQFSLSASTSPEYHPNLPECNLLPRSAEFQRLPNFNQSLGNPAATTFFISIHAKAITAPNGNRVSLLIAQISQ